MPPPDGQRQRSRRPGYARQRPNLLEDLVVEVELLSLVLGTFAGELHVKCQKTIGIQAHVHVLQGHEAAPKQRGTGQQGHGQGTLQRDQYLSRA